MWAIIRVTNSFRGRVEMTCRSLHQSPVFHHGTIDQQEVNKFSELCHNWWNEAGDLKALHTLNQLRVPLIRDGLTSNQNTTTPLHGLSILDVGCGGGILTECLARLGASVTGIDASEENIEAAQWHASLDPAVQKNTKYLAHPVELMEEKAIYDAVVASEIVEHVNNINTFVKSCCDLLKPGGSLFVTTINRTWLSWALAVVAAEKIFKLVPDGSHDWSKFIKDQELADLLHQNNMRLKLVHGMLLNPLTLRWQWVGDTSMNYALHAVKETTDSDTTDSSSDSSSDSE